MREIYLTSDSYEFYIFYQVSSKVIRGQVQLILKVKSDKMTEWQI